MGLKKDGTVRASGLGTWSQCDVFGWSGIVQVAAGICETVGLKADGTVMVAGELSYDQSHVSGWADVVQVAAGGYDSGDNYGLGHVVGLRSDALWWLLGPTAGTNARSRAGADVVQVAAGGQQPWAYPTALRWRWDGSTVSGRLRGAMSYRWPRALGALWVSGPMAFLQAGAFDHGAVSRPTSAVAGVCTISWCMRGHLGDPTSPSPLLRLRHLCLRSTMPSAWASDRLSLRWSVWVRPAPTSGTSPVVPATGHRH